jgi:predicted ArsR family transcriptional regulator
MKMPIEMEEWKDAESIGGNEKRQELVEAFLKENSGMAYSAKEVAAELDMPATTAGVCMNALLRKGKVTRKRLIVGDRGRPLWYYRWVGSEDAPEMELDQPK